MLSNIDQGAPINKPLLYGHGGLAVSERSPYGREGKKKPLCINKYNGSAIMLCMSRG